MVTNGYIERVNVRNKDSFSQNNTVNDEVGDDGNSSISVCVRLLKPFNRATRGVDDDKKEIITGTVNVSEVGRGLVINLPIEYQIFQKIIESGSEGITTVDLRKFFRLSTKVLIRSIENIDHSKLIRSCAECIGKERHVRYFGKNVKKFKHHFNINIKPDPRFDIPVRKTEDVIMEETPQNILMSESKPLENLQVVTYDEVKLDPSLPHDSITAAIRRHNLLKLLETERILELDGNLCKRYLEIYPNLNQLQMDTKTLRRACDILKNQNKLVMREIAIQKSMGNYGTKTIIVINN